MPNRLPLLQFATGSITSAASGTATFANPIAANSTLILAVAEAPTTTFTINTPTDNFGNTWTLMSKGDSGSGVATGMYYLRKFAAAAGALTVTCNFTASTKAVFFIAEYAGLAQFTAGNPYDPSAGANPSFKTVTSAAPATNALTTRENATTEIAIMANVSSATYSGTMYNLNTVSNGTLSAVLADIQQGAPGSKTLTLTQAPSALCHMTYACMLGDFSTNNNYKFIKVADGMSVSEKIS